MRQVTCTDCGRRRDPYRPIVRLVDGTVCFTCRQCWRAFGYAGGLTVTPTGALVRHPGYLDDAMTEDDRAVLRGAR